MNKLSAFFLLFFIIGCKDRYDIPIRNTDQSLLVVEGALIVGPDSTAINLSRTVKVNDNVSFNPVFNARLTVEDKNGNTFLLKEIGNGKYASGSLGLIAGKEYRLRIKTNDSKEYLSDYVVARQTPAIDSISWKKENGDVVIYANTHDATNNTRYYKWGYDETWEIRSHYTSYFQYLGGTTIMPTLLPHNSRCWKYGSSTTINIGSSAQLSSDVIKEFPLLAIPNGSEKLSVRYSVFVGQQSLAREAYEYLQIMKKNTESIGSVFDPLPSELRGNIHCVSNPDEDVIGFLTASSLSQKRIFITPVEADWKFFEDCNEVDSVLDNPDSLKQWLPGFLPWSSEQPNPLGPKYYLMSPAPCVDCTLRNGSLGMPSYW